MMRLGIGKLLRDETGVSAVEYGLLLAFIVLAIFAASTILGTNLSGDFNKMAGYMDH